MFIYSYKTFHIIGLLLFLDFFCEALYFRDGILPSLLWNSGLVKIYLFRNNLDRFEIIISSTRGIYGVCSSNFIPFGTRTFVQEIHTAPRYTGK